MDIADPADTPAARAFQRAMLFSFQTRQDHRGKIAPAFFEFVREPDISAHWESLGPGAVADMIHTASALAARARTMGGGGTVDSLPVEIRTHPEYGPLVDAARTLTETAADGETVLQAECIRLVAEIHTNDAVAIFAALIMSVFPAPGSAGS